MSLEVLIVGAGPTGLMLACELVRSNVSFRIVDKITEPSTRSRALVVHARTLELLEKLGVAEELAARGVRTLRAHLFINKRRAADFEIDDTGIDDTPFRYVLMVSQAETERVLREWLEAHGVDIERGVEVTNVEPTFGEATLRTPTGEERVKARYVIGCDGSHSIVRHAGKFAFEGEPYPQDFVLADIHLASPVDGLNLCFDDRGFFVVLPLGGGIYRIITSRADAPATMGDPTLRDVQELADALSPFPVVLQDPVWLARFRLHHRQTDQYRRGPLFLAGDAAHIHSPAGGQGMNTGMQDAANLAWKLALVVRGQADEALLDSYHEERHPVGRDLLRTTDRLFSINTAPDAWIRGLRNFAVRYLAKPMLSSRERRAWLFRFMAELKVRYTDSSIVFGSGQGGPRPGERAPDAPVSSHDTTIFALTREPVHHLLVVTDDKVEADAFAARVARPWLAVHGVVGPFSQPFRERYAIQGDALFLIRPDGYVGMSARGLDHEAVARYGKQLGLREE